MTGLLKEGDLIALAKKLVQIGMPMLQQMLVAAAELDEGQDPEPEDAPFRIVRDDEILYHLPDGEWMYEYEFTSKWDDRYPDLTDRSTLLIAVDWVRRWAIECGADWFEISDHYNRNNGDSFASISVSGLIGSETFFGDDLDEALYNAMVVLVPRVEGYEEQARRLLAEGYEASEDNPEGPYLTKGYTESKMFDMPIVYAVRRLQMKGEA